MKLRAKLRQKLAKSQRKNALLGTCVAVFAGAMASSCSPYAHTAGPQRSTVWGMLPMDAVVSGTQQHDLTVETAYWPFMQLQAEKDLFAVKFSWMRPDEQPSNVTTGAWLEFLAPQGGSFDEEPEAVHAELESSGSKIPVKVVRLPVEGGRYILTGVPLDAGSASKLFITAEFGDRQDSVVIPVGTDSRE